LQEEANKLELKFLVNQAITDIILAYRQVIRTQLAVEIADKSLIRSRQIESDTRKLITAGRIAASEIILSQSSVYQQEIGLLGARNDAEQAMTSLLKIIGANLDETAAPGLNGTADYKKFNMSTSVERALDANPQVTAQNFRIEAARKDLEVAQNQKLWDLSLVGGVGYSRDGPQFDNQESRTELVGGVQLTIPLDNLEAETRETQANVALKDAQIQFAELRAVVQQAVRNAIQDTEVKWKQYELSKRVRQNAIGALDAARKRLALGRSTNFEVQSLEDELRTAEIAELDAMIDYQNAIAAADLAIGTTVDTWGISL
jgi:outer membrane protein TolC